MILLNFATQIKGDSQVEGHKDWITVDSCSFGVSRQFNISGAGTSRDVSNPMFQDIGISKSTDVASADLFAQATWGKSLGDCTIKWIRTGEDKKVEVYLTVILSEAIVATYNLSSGGERPNESLSINFTKISYQYDDFSGTTKTTGTAKKFDLMKNTTF